jgi:hypothetical protein
MPTKPKTNQPETPNNIQGRDIFQTPNYATELLIPFIPKNIDSIWECACGNYKISWVLKNHNYHVVSTDLKYGDNFLASDINDYLFYSKNIAIITNPPFSLKRKFFEKCLFYDLPFALLIPADYCLWIIDAIRKYGCEKIIPDHRINYITPNGNSGKNSASQFHTMWLTKGFSLGRTETFVELPKELTNNI